MSGHCLRFGEGCARFVCPNQSVARLPPWLPVDYRPWANTCRTDEHIKANTRSVWHTTRQFVLMCACSNNESKRWSAAPAAHHCLRLICTIAASFATDVPVGCVHCSLQTKGENALDLIPRRARERESATRRTRRRRNSGIFFFIASQYISPWLRRGRKWEFWSSPARSTVAWIGSWQNKYFLSCSLTHRGEQGSNRIMRVFLIAFC